MPRTANQHAPRLYPLRDIALQRTADHVDCDDGSHSRPLRGFSDDWLELQTAYVTDHPHTLSHEEIARL